MTAMCFSVLPVNVFAWSSKSHANSANILLLETQRSDKANDNNRATVTLYAPYDDHINGKYSYTIPEETMTINELAFRGAPNLKEIVIPENVKSLLFYQTIASHIILIDFIQTRKYW